ncbi:CBS domain-containing protein [Pelobium sp.]|nr:CBS domain-containing protein [Pelobium sp.]MDA9554752.1 CBS domain-containing protein [Pelobium sp.]
MVAIELISNAIRPIKTSDTIQKVADCMAEFRVNQLPIVRGKQFLGLISENDFTDVSDYSLPVSAINLSAIHPYVTENQHVYDVIRVFNDQKLSVLPILDHNMDYLGVITINEIIEDIASLTSVAQPGGIIVLEIGNRDNSLAHIAQIVESENAQILSSYTNSLADSTKIEVTLKVNKTDISQIVASFLRYEYVVIATYNYVEKDSGASDRFDSFMNYLSF